MADDISDVIKEVGILTKLVKSLKSSNEDLKKVKSSDNVDVKGGGKDKLQSEFKREEGITVTGFSTSAIEQLKLISPGVGDQKDPVKSVKKGGGLMEATSRLRAQGLKKGGIARGCGAVMSDRRKKTKMY